MAKPSKSPMSRLNMRLATLLSVIAVLSAVPVASARPSWWLLWAAVLAVISLYWLLQSWRLTPNRALQSRDVRPYLIAASIVPLYAVLQSVPLPFTIGAMREGAEILAGNRISVLPDASWLGAIRFGSWILLFILIYEVTTSRERMLRISWILFIGIALQAIWALLALRVFGDIALFGEKTTYKGAATGTFVNRNSLATFLGFGLLLGAALLSRRLGEANMRMSRVPTLLERLGATGAMILLGMTTISIALIATQSRLGILASLIALWITSLILLKQNNRMNKAVWTCSALSFLAALIVIVIAGQGGVADRLIFLQGSGDERFAIYTQTLELISHRPLLGFGFDAFGPAFEAFRAPPLNAPVFYDLAHNSYLGLWAEQGLIIGSIPPVLLIIALLILIKKVKAGADFPVASTTAIGALILGGIHSLGDFSLEIPANNFVFIIILAMGLARRNQRNTADKAQKLESS